MATIRVLSDIVANRIAAGEVVERPESVVKELVENALDAGADDIRVLIKNGGKTGITIIDNGSGMGFDDALLAFERHATSKIKNEQDLMGIATLGFRGEALPSIASVSRLLLSTKEKDSNEAGTVIQVVGGVVKKVTRAPVDPGTRIEVNGLFFNMPARKKFLKKTETESGRILRMVTSYALANPDVAFSLTTDGKMTVRFDGRQSLEDRIRTVLGGEFSKGTADGLDVAVSCYLLPPEHNLKSPMKQYFLLNGRFVRDRTLTGAVLAAYRNVAGQVSGYPQIVVRMKVDPMQVDVNVHPSKLEVRFRNQSAVYDAVRSACEVALAGRMEVPGVLYEQRRDRLITQYQPYGAGSTYSRPVGEQRQQPWVTERRESVPSGDPVAGGWDGSAAETGRPLMDAGFTVLAQFQETYILVEREGALYIVDQHAAHERILFEDALARVTGEGIQQNRLLVPETVNVGPELVAVLQEKNEAVLRAGYRAEAVDDNTVKITACPIFVPNGEIRTTFAQLLDLVFAEREADLDALHRDVAALIGCKAAIKANRSLTTSEMHNLVADLLRTDNPFYCPHGRPVILKLTLSEIEKLFKRS